MHDLAHVLLGAGLVAIGVVAAALADRIRGLKMTRADRGMRAAKQTAESDPLKHGVMSALVASGYSKRAAADAVAGCAPDQRATLESWTRAALRRCARCEA